ncbi:MAG TPA: DUF4124 domain-containing protein [Rhodanobacter sp.]|jgi:hypothetical protein|nr:DUF4124 domain-containing protein [Rhodanobacter sp.]
MHKLLLPLVAALLFASQFALAQESSHVRYKWQDAQGLVHFSDSLSAEAMKYGYAVVNDQGLVVGRVQRQLTPDERAAANKLAAQQAAQQRAARDLANSETQMLNAYPDESAFRIYQQQTLETIDQRIHTTQINLRSQEGALTDLLARAADLERSKEPVPPSLVDSIAKQRNIVTGQRNVLTQQQAGRVKTVQAQSRQLTRYRELQAAQKQAEP